MDKLVRLDGLVISQKREWGEILTGFETKNKYAVLDTSGQPLYAAAEEGGNFLVCGFLKAMRPFTVTVYATDGTPVLTLKRPFRFIYHELSITDASGQVLGRIRKRFSLLRRIYDVTGPDGQSICELFGPILHPWTFQVLVNGEEKGKITKTWNGLLKEGFTDADNFGITFPVDLPVTAKAVLLGAVFLIDFVHFENRD